MAPLADGASDKLTIPAGSMRQLTEASFRLGEADVRAFRWNGLELIRRIFVSVRDANWQEITPCEFRMESDDEGRIAFHALHGTTSDRMVFEWSGRFGVEEGGKRACFSFVGRPECDLEVCRLGLIVLFPVELLTSNAIVAQTVAGAERVGVEDSIYPQAIVDDVPQAMTEPFSRLSIHARNLGELACRFSGDAFELEDQRNWGDASFKAYCTPLREGFPRMLRAGEEIRHAVEFEFKPDAGAAFPVQQENRTRMLATIDAGFFPRVGVIAGGDVSTIPEAPWSHLRLEEDECWGVATQPRRSTGRTSIELAMADGVEAAGDTDVADSLLAALRGHGSSIDRLLLHGPGVSIARQAAIDEWRDWLCKGGGYSVPVFAATRGCLVEFNRKEALRKDIDGIAFPLSPTVHADDPWTIAENPSVISDMVATARILSGGRDVAISPLALNHPPLPGNGRFPEAVVVPWTAACLVRLAVSQITSVTLGRDTVEALARTGDGRRLLERFIGYAGRALITLDTCASPDVHLMAMRDGRDRAELLAVNLATDVVELHVAHRVHRDRVQCLSGDMQKLVSDANGSRLTLQPLTVLTLSLEIDREVAS